MHHLVNGRNVAIRFVLAFLAALVVIVLPLAAPTSSARAETADEPTVRWSVTPADADGPDGRRSIEHEADPGEILEEHFAVHNVGSAEVTFALTAADGFYTRAGRFDILADGQESVDAGTWISLPDTVTVAGGATVVVPITIQVPDRAEPGDHAAGITASILSTKKAEDGTSVGVESRVGFRIAMRVAGEITPAAALSAVAGGYTTSWNPFRPGDATVSFDVVNEGNTRLLAEGSVSAGGQTLTFPAEGEAPQELLPGDTRTIVVAVNDVWPLVAVPATVTLTPTALTMSDEPEEIAAVTAEAVVWALPWPQLAVVGGLALLIWAILWGRGRSRRRLDALLEDAREQGRLEGRGPTEPALRSRRGRSVVAFVAALVAVPLFLPMAAHAAPSETGDETVTVTVQIDPIVCTTDCPPAGPLPATGLESVEPVVWIGLALLAVGAVIVIRRRAQRRTAAADSGADSGDRL